jgi:hypothetical protein
MATRVTRLPCCALRRHARDLQSSEALRLTASVRSEKRKR